MDRNREARRVSMNGVSRRRHRSSTLRDSPEDDVVLETQDTTRLRERKKERDQQRERERDRDRRSSKRRRGGERLIHSNGVDTSEESVNDEEDEDDEDSSIPSLRMLPPNHHLHHHTHNNTNNNNNNSLLSSSSFTNHHHSSNNNNNISGSNHHLHRKSFPPPAKVFRAAPAPVSGTAAVSAPWKAPDEMIGVSVPRKARSASTKRSHEWASSSGGVTEQIHWQASTSPVRSSGGGAVMGSICAASPAAPVSPPSSSNISVKKKMKPNGPKQRPPKSLSSSKPVSSSQDEIEIEIAEVLYGLMRQPQASNKQEIVGGDSMKVDSKEMSSKPAGDAKSRVSSPISNSPSSALPRSSSVPPADSSSSAPPMSAIAPKRKRPRPVKYEDENPSSVLPVRNWAVENDRSAKIESNLDKSQGSAVENGTTGFDLLANQAVPSSREAQTEPVKQENNSVTDAKPSSQASESKDLGVSSKKEPMSPSKESNPGIRSEESLTVSKSNAEAPEVETYREEKFQIDLMAPPPSRSSPERDSEIDIGSADPKPTVTDVETELKPVVKEEDKAVKIAKDDINLELEEKKAKVVPEEADSHKPIGNKEKNIDLQLDLEKTDRESGSVSLSGNKPHIHVQSQKQHQQPSSEKNAQPNSLSLPMSMASWPGGLPPMGYMAPLQGVVSMDGATVPSPAIQPPHLLFNQPRPKRCATHCYIARNILYHQQFTRMNPYWPAAPGSALQFGAKSCNVNVVPSSELLPGRGSVQDKGQSLAIFPPHSGKDKSSQPANIVDTAQRKQILLQQALPPGAPNNILHGPALMFPLGQQPGAAGASVRPGTMKSPPAAGSASLTSTSSSAPVSATAAAVTGAAMSFSYPNMPGNETQYLAILQNGAYPIPIPPHVGANPAYRGAHPPAMPFFNGSFYSSQMLHPSALPQQQPPPTQSSQSQQGHQNPSISSGSSSSQKHLQNQQARPHASGVNVNGGNLQTFPGQKNLPSQSMQLQSRQQNSNHMPLPTRQLESEVGGEESPSTANSRVSRANMSIYGQNFGMLMHPPPNFTLMTPTSVTAANTTNNPGAKKQQQQAQSHGSSQPFAMSFAFNGAAATPGLDISSIAPNHPLLQSIPEAARPGYFMAAAATVGQTAQQKKNFRPSEEGKVGGNDGSNTEEERKVMAGGKATVASAQSIAFSRPDLTDAPGSAMPGNVVIDTSARPINLGSNSVRGAGTVMSAAVATVGVAGVQQQMPRDQQQFQIRQKQQQLFHLQQKQQQFAAAAVASARSKPPATSNGTVFPDQISTSSSMPGKFPTTLSAFPQNLVQSSSSPAQSPQWKGSVRTAAPQVSSPTLASTSSSVKNLPQQQIRTQQSHTQISFAGNPKSSAVAQGQPPSSNQSASPPLVVGSPTTSSISKSAGGSPRTTSTSTSNKGGQTSSLSSQQAKNSSAVANQKSSPVIGRNTPSILGHPQSTISTPGSSMKPQLTQQQQQHLQKQAAYQQQMFYMQPAAASSTNNAPAATGFYLQRHRGEQPQQQSQGSSTTSSTGMLTLGPPSSLTNTGTTDPAKAVAAAVGANNMKGGSLPSNYAQFAAAQSSGKGHQFVPGFSFVHPVPSPVQVKPAEQKQPAGE